MLDENRKILDPLGDFKEAPQAAPGKNKNGSTSTYTSDTVLRIVVCHIIEFGLLQEIILRIDDNHFLRRFVRIDSGAMIAALGYHFLNVGEIADRSLDAYPSR